VWTKRALWVVSIVAALVGCKKLLRPKPDVSDASVDASGAGADRSRAGDAGAPKPRGEVSFEVLVAGTHYTEAQVRGVLDAARAVLESCYDGALATNAGTAGEMVLLVAAKPTGEVQRVVDLDHGPGTARTLREPAMRGCVVANAAKWAFPKHDKDDVEGAVLVITFEHEAARAPLVDAGAEPSAISGAYTSVFVNKSTGQAFPATDATVKTTGALAAVDYPDGTMGCTINEDDLACKWVQEDTNGGASLRRRKSGLMRGTWGFDPSDSNGGAWTLTPKKHK
jgi:hypothetical protein